MAIIFSFTNPMIVCGAIGLLAQATPDLANEVENAQNLLDDLTTRKIAQALIIGFIAYFSDLFLEKIINWISEQVRREWRLSIKQSIPFLRMFVLTLVIIILMNLFLDLSRTNVFALTGTIAVTLGFAFKDYASSVIAGIVSLFEVPYRVGDRVKINDNYGEVVSYGLRGIRLRTPTDDIVTIPHNLIWTNAISNANTGQLEAQVTTDFYLAHGVDIEFVIQLLIRVAYTSKYTQLKCPVFVFVEEKAWGTLFQLKSYPMDARDEFLYKTDLIKRAKRAFAKHRLPYPKMPYLDIESP